MSAPTERVIEKFNPASGEKVADYHISTPEEVHEAVARAREAFPRWAALSVEERLARLQAVRTICVEEGQAIAERLSLDTGKPYVESLMHEVATVPLFIDHYEKIAPKLLSPQKERTPLFFPGKESYTTYFPMGVIGVISPWNFPFRLSMAPVVSALSAGNTVVLKPSEVTPESGEVMREIFERANLGRGVVEVCQGDGSTGAALVDADIDKIFFTGSVGTGRKVMKAAAEKPIPVELELGGKDAHIVCHDADLDRAAKALAWAGLMNCGQMCVSAERIIVVESVYEPFVRKLKEAAEKVTVGSPEEHADMGPMTFPPQIETVEEHVGEAVEKGAKIEMGGERIDRPGTWYAPTLVTEVSTDMKIWTEETFGPVLPVIKARDEDEAIHLCNNHKYGLTGSIWTEDRKRGFALAQKFEAGQVMVNDVIQVTGNPALPFGGVKHSGIGRYHSEEGLLTFVHTRAVMIDKGWFKNEPYWFPYKGKYDLFRKAYDALFRSGSLPKAFFAITRIRKLTE